MRFRKSANPAATPLFSKFAIPAVFVALVAGAAGVLAQTGTMPQKHALPAQEKSASIEKEPIFTDLPGYGKKCWIGDSLYFTYKFSQKPKMGTAVLKIQLFDKKGARVTSPGIIGMVDMPAMRGAHDSGEVPFKLNKKGDYLLPVNIVMPGEWEVKLIFLKDKEPIFRGRFTFKV